MIELLEFTCARCDAVNRLKVKRILEMTHSPKCGGCREPLLRLMDEPLADLSPESYTHPLDKEALGALEKVPGVKTLLKSLLQHTRELSDRLNYAADCLRVSEKQVPSLYARFRLAADRLGVTNLPELYIYQSATPNAFTGGVEKHYMCISTGGLDLWTDEEQLAVLAHELGHVHANHVLYKTAARVLTAAAAAGGAAMGAGALVVYPLRLALSRWDRASELTADRAALLVVRRPEIVLSLLMKMAGGSRTVMPELNIDAFIEQAESFEKMRDDTGWAKFNVMIGEMNRSHPFSVYRAREVLDYVSSGSFLEILDGDYTHQAKPPEHPCASCGKSVVDTLLVCPHCGHAEEDLRGEKVSGAGGEDGGTDATLGERLDKSFDDARSWFKRVFSSGGEGPEGPDSNGGGGEPPGPPGGA